MTSEVINVHEAKTHLSRLLDEVRQGKEIILAKGGKPYARLVPLVDAVAGRRAGRFGGKVGPEFFEPLPEKELAAWEGGTRPKAAKRTAARPTPRATARR